MISYIHSNSFRELWKEPLAGLGLHGVVAIFGPVVVEVLFDFEGHVFREGPSLIKAGEQSEPFGEILVILVFGSHDFKFHQHVYEVAHDKRKDGNTEQNDESANYQLCVAHRVKVSIAHRSQGRKCEIDDRYHAKIKEAFVSRKSTYSALSLCSTTYLSKAYPF